MAVAEAPTAGSKRFPPWQIAELPQAPVFRLRYWTMLIGPGLLMVGANIGGGEWLFGPLAHVCAFFEVLLRNSLKTRGRVCIFEKV
jgi:hypothetical protein